ncbi:hypothetical protein THOM_1722 [Trachipleistophora hominis]|uniref:Uncharacterized protein n=1 Tax=Trachipleistophora hominis TaxID=72359 RepID=L7JWA9_TRAHO|nr:hypothetical protein THOM_1722 [Trachipleistophora hominis]
MNNMEHCFKLPIRSTNTIDKLLNYVNKNRTNKQSVYQYIIDEQIDLGIRLDELTDSEHQIKFVMLLRRILPNNEFMSIFNDCDVQTLGMACRNVRWYCCELLIRYNRTTKIFGYRLNGYNIFADQNCRTNTSTGVLYVFFNHSDIKLYDNKKIIPLSYKTLLKYTVDATKLILYKERIRIELYIKDICSYTIDEKFTELGITRASVPDGRACSDREISNAMKVSVPIKNIYMKSNEYTCNDSIERNLVHKKVQVGDGLEFTITSKLKRSVHFDFRKAFDDSLSDSCSGNNDQINIRSADQKVKEENELAVGTVTANTKSSNECVIKDCIKANKNILSPDNTCSLNNTGVIGEKAKMHRECLSEKKTSIEQDAKEDATCKTDKTGNESFLNFNSCTDESDHEVIHNGDNKTDKASSNASLINHSIVSECKSETFGSDINKIFGVNIRNEHLQSFHQADQNEREENNHSRSLSTKKSENIFNSCHIKSSSSFKATKRRKSQRKKRILLESVSYTTKHMMYHQSNVRSTITSNGCAELVKDTATKENTKYKNIIYEYMSNYKNMMYGAMSAVRKDLKVLSKGIKYLINYKIKYN